MSYHLYRAILVVIITGLIVSVFRWVIDHTMQILLTTTHYSFDLDYSSWSLEFSPARCFKRFGH